MNHTLAGCEITGPFKNPAPDFEFVKSSLCYQSNALGIKIEANENCSGDGAFSFEFKTPHTAPITCGVSRWNGTSQHAPVTENIMQAACGLMSVHGRAGGKAQPLGLNYVSTLTAALALQGGIAASIGQLRGLTVSSSSVSMASAALLSVGQYIAGATASESPETPETLKNLFPGPTPPPVCLPFVSLDGVIFELETLDAGPWQKFWAEMGVSSAVAGKGWVAFLLRYARAISPLPDELAHATSNITYHRISQICARTGMAICAVRSVDDRAMDDDNRRIWLQGPWEFLFDRNLNGRNGAHDKWPSRATDDLPLSGLTVVESCRRIQGPLAGHLLALLGAHVIRIEPPGGDPLRGMPPMAGGCSARFDALNRLKTVREIDIKSSDGQAEIKELAAEADVFLHNWAPGKAVLLNLGDEDLAAINPSLIYAYAAGWASDSAAHVSPSAMPGTDFMAQAYSGVAKKIAGVSGDHGGSLFTVLDVLGGVVSAQGITIALLKRCMNKVGASVTSSLMSAATLLCAEDFRNIYNLPSSGSKTPTSIINTVYTTREGKIAIECPDVETALRLSDALAAAAGVENPEQSLCDLFLSRTAEEWARIFEQACIPSAVVIEDLSDLQTIACLQPGLSPGPYTKVNSPWRFK
jgi:crotonobetainyl-CoA:carnitine CoA-transferase CaiB-like acyl-CoA transferase